MTTKKMESTRINRFAGKLNLKEENQTATVSAPKTESAPKQSLKKTETVPAKQAPTQKLVKREAKRDNPSYQQISAYLKKDTYIALKTSLFTSGEELSDLLERLVTQHLKK